MGCGQWLLIGEGGESKPRRNRTLGIREAPRAEERDLARRRAASPAVPPGLSRPTTVAVPGHSQSVSAGYPEGDVLLGERSLSYLAALFLNRTCFAPVIPSRRTSNHNPASVKACRSHIKAQIHMVGVLCVE